MPKRYDEQTKAKAVRLVRDHVDDYASEWEAITTVAGRLGMSSETLRKWVRRTEADEGRRSELLGGEERERLKELERENRELRRANEILKSASAFFAAELDPRRTK